jgi:hypothetical protein
MAPCKVGAGVLVIQPDSLDIDRHAVAPFPVYRSPLERISFPA